MAHKRLKYQNLLSPRRGRNWDRITTNYINRPCLFLFNIYRKLFFDHLLMSMKYFKPRDLLDFQGTLWTSEPGKLGPLTVFKALFKIVFAIDKDRLEEFYKRHLA